MLAVHALLTSCSRAAHKLLTSSHPAAQKRPHALTARRAEALERKCPTSPAVLELSGLGGMGKTQCALEFAHQGYADGTYGAVRTQARRLWRRGDHRASLSPPSRAVTRRPRRRSRG